jgi:hypothetical protein
VTVVAEAPGVALIDGVQRLTVLEEEGSIKEPSWTVVTVGTFLRAILLFTATSVTLAAMPGEEI